MAEERLQKILAAAGIASRRKAEELILAGRVSVNGATVLKLGSKADLATDEVKVDGQRLSAPTHFVYYALHKPKNCVTTVFDPEGRETVMKFFKGVKERIYPVGRLDYASEGLLLLTNDGDFAAKLTAPASHISKTYLVKVNGLLTAEQEVQFREGIPMHGRRTAPAGLRLLKKTLNPWYEVRLIEGRQNQIRVMFKHFGHLVEKLKRTRIGFLELGALKGGVYRTLTNHEVERFKKVLDTPAELRKEKFPAPAKRSGPPPERATGFRAKHWGDERRRANPDEGGAEEAGQEEQARPPDKGRGDREKPYYAQRAGAQGQSRPFAKKPFSKKPFSGERSGETGGRAGAEQPRPFAKKEFSKKPFSPRDRGPQDRGTDRGGQSPPLAKKGFSKPSFSGERTAETRGPRGAEPSRPYVKKGFSKPPFSREDRGSQERGADRSEQSRPFEKKPFSKKPFSQERSAETRGPRGAEPSRPYVKKSFSKPPFSREDRGSQERGAGRSEQSRPFEKKPFSKKPFPQERSAETRGSGGAEQSRPFVKKSFSKPPFSRERGGQRSAPGGAEGRSTGDKGPRRFPSKPAGQSFRGGEKTGGVGGERRGRPEGNAGRSGEKKPFSGRPPGKFGKPRSGGGSRGPNRPGKGRS